MSNANAFAGTEDKPISTCAEIVTAPERGAAHDDALTCLAHFVIDFFKVARHEADLRSHRAVCERLKRQARQTCRVEPEAVVACDAPCVAAQCAIVRHMMQVVVFWTKPLLQREQPFLFVIGRSQASSGMSFLTHDSRPDKAHSRTTGMMRRRRTPHTSRCNSCTRSCSRRSRHCTAL